MLKFRFYIMIGWDRCELYYVEAPRLALDPCPIHKSQSNRSLCLPRYLLDSYLLTLFPGLTLDLSHYWKYFWSLWTVADPGYHHWICSSSPICVLLKGSRVFPCQLCLWFAFFFLILLQLGSQYMNKNFKYEVVLATHWKK